jgi:hypothetical protein
MEYVEGFEENCGCGNIRKFAKRLKEVNIREWEAD